MAQQSSLRHIKLITRTLELPCMQAINGCDYYFARIRRAGAKCNQKLFKSLKLLYLQKLDGGRRRLPNGGITHAHAPVH